MTDLEKNGRLVKEASRKLAGLNGGEKARLLRAAAGKIAESRERIISENMADVAAARADGKGAAFIDRLTLTDGRVDGMVSQLNDVAALGDPCGESVGRVLPNGLAVTQKRVPIGVIGLIFESRPNVVAEAFAVCFKAGNGVILRGGKEAIRTNAAIAEAIRAALGELAGCLYLVTDTGRESADEMMRMKGTIDVLIPRGGRALIKAVAEHSLVPVIETGAGNCHIYVDINYNEEQAVNIIVNAKTGRPGVCNAAEKLIVHAASAAAFLPVVCAALREKGVELRGNEASRAIEPSLIPATEEDWETEYEDLIMSIAVLPGLGAAIEHINKYGTGHSEAIITQNFQHAKAFTERVDAAAVYVNASTRFTDGGEFGLGAEVGISTQRLHARGPLGPRELTTTKYVVIGDGHIRA